MNRSELLIKTNIMKSFIPLILLLSTVHFSVAQVEFSSTDTDLMYSMSTIAQLTDIVDSLNLRYKSCDLDREYRAEFQAKAIVFLLRGAMIDRAVEAVRSGIGPDELLSRFPEMQSDELLILRQEKQKGGKTRYSYRMLGNGGVSGQIYGDDVLHLHDSWIVSANTSPSYGDPYFRAIYAPNGFSSPVLPEKYARAVGYADCLIDTTTTVMLEDAERGFPRLQPDWRSMPVAEQRTLLQTMRRTRVVGSCSQDDSPRRHARNIAILAAETINWEIFLRAHLDIMNDRFERISDGSYAWAQRQTYLRELEVIGIDVFQLMRGISLQIDNPAENHYFGSIRRVGRALADSQDQELASAMMIEMIADPELDDYNRYAAYYLFLNYAYHLPDEAAKKTAQERLAIATGGWPEYLENSVAEE